MLSSWKSFVSSGKSFVFRRPNCYRYYATKLSDREYRPFSLISKTSVNYNTNIYTFQIHMENDIPLGKHLSARAVIDGKNIMRSYTPITPKNVKGKLDFLIKVYPQGKMSSHIESLKIGESLEFMGPIGNLKYTPKMYPNIGMIAGGTGITPLYQIIQHVLSDPQDSTSITLLYANNQEIDILLTEELQKFQQQHPSRFFVHHVLAEVPPSKNYEKGYITKEIIKKYLNTKSLLLVCGPPKMEEIMLGHLDTLNVQKIHQMVFTYSATHQVTETLQPQVKTKEFTMEEVAIHNKEGNCWLVIEGKVYDISSFVDEHPGGYIILDGAGKDATSLFNVDFAHSDDARDDLKKLEIGKLKI